MTGQMAPPCNLATPSLARARGGASRWDLGARPAAAWWWWGSGALRWQGPGQEGASSCSPAPGRTQGFLSAGPQGGDTQHRLGKERRSGREPRRPKLLRCTQALRGNREEAIT